MVSAAIVNTDLRDNLLVLSTHAHSGAAGMGNDELSGVDSIAFDDLAASPNAAGELQRNGVNLEWYGAAVVAVTEADAAVGTASPRTLGTGAQQAAVGNHTHTPGTPNVTEVNTGVFVNDNNENNLGTGTITVQGANESLVLVATVVAADGSDTYTLRLYFETTLLDSHVGLIGGTDTLVLLQGLEVSPTAALHNFKVTVQRTAGTSSGNPNVTIVAREVAR